MKYSIQLILANLFVCTLAGYTQQKQDWMLDKMPADLEMQYALSALPPHLRDGATVYLLDPTKGYYKARQGNNGFSAFINRTQWEAVEFAQDYYEPIAYDSVGSQVYLQPFFDVAAMRASGKYTPPQIRDIVVQRVHDGVYKPASKPGISYMLSPLLRNKPNGKIVNQVMPHYMFYAPCLDDNDIGGQWVTGGHQPFVAGSGPVLDKAHSIFNVIIIAAGETEKAKIVEENEELLKKLAEYKPCLKVDVNEVVAEHHH